MLNNEQLSLSFEISALIALERNAELNAEERRHLEMWLHSNESNRIIYEKLQDDSLLEKDLIYLNSFDPKKALEAVSFRIDNEKTSKKSANLKLFYYAAAAIILVLFGLFFYNNLFNKYNPRIGDNFLASNHVKIETSIGEIREIKLPDGTKVRLGAASSLSYSRTFDDVKHRNVTLNGEAYFDVARDTSRKFTVKTKFQKIEVLGTRFLVEGYGDDEKVKTSLFSGKIKIKPNSAKDVVLSPGQQSLVTSFAVRINTMSNSLSPSDRPSLDYINFEKETIDQVMKKLSRWYNIKVRYDGPIGTSKISGSISTDVTLPEVVEILSLLFPDDSIKLKDSLIVIKNQKHKRL